MSPTDHVRTLRDYAKRYIAYGFEETFDPDDADDIADYIEKLEAALDDMSKYVSRADWHYIKPETIASLERKDD